MTWTWHRCSLRRFLALTVAFALFAASALLVIAGPTAPALHPASPDVSAGSTTPPVIYDPEPTP